MTVTHVLTNLISTDAENSHTRARACFTLRQFLSSALCFVLTYSCLQTIYIKMISTSVD